MKTTLSRQLLGVAILSLLLSLGHITGFSQLIEIKNKIPKSVPLEVEFKKYDKENWVHDLEIKVTNTGKKPISYLYLLLILDLKTESGDARGFPLNFGNGIAAYSDEGLAEEGDPSILPNETYTFKIKDYNARAWDYGKSRDNFIKPRIADLEFGWLSFGDGTGIAGGGKAYVKKKKVF